MRAVAYFLFLGLLAAEDRWTQFRGPNGSGVDSATGYPTEFSPTKNVVWKTAIPYGQSSPVLAGGRAYLTASEKDKLLTIAIDAKTGTLLWRREIPRKKTMEIFRANDPASPTPLADENGVVAFFPEVGLVAYTATGKDQWTVPLGPFKNFYGMAASPIIVGNTVVMVCDQQGAAFLLAVDRKTGQQRWKTARPGFDIGWATPMMFRPTTGQAQLIVLGSSRLDSYYPETGESRWWTPVGSAGSMGTPVASGNKLLIETDGASEPSMPTFQAVLATYDKDHDGRLSQQEFKADKDWGEHFGWVDSNSDGFVTLEEWNVARSLGQGDYGVVAIEPAKAQGKLAGSEVKWRFKKNLPYIPAPLVYDNVYYMVRDGGIITSLHPETGALLKQGRATNALGEYYASPVAADQKIFLANGEGKMTVLKAGPQWEVAAVNDLGDEVHATPALADGRIYVRTRSFLYCFGKPVR